MTLKEQIAQIEADTQLIREAGEHMRRELAGIDRAERIAAASDVVNLQFWNPRNVWHPDYKPKPSFGITADNLDEHIVHRPMQAARPILGDATCRSLGFTLDQGD